MRTFFSVQTKIAALMSLILAGPAAGSDTHHHYFGPGFRADEIDWEEVERFFRAFPELRPRSTGVAVEIRLDQLGSKPPQGEEPRILTYGIASAVGRGYLPVLSEHLMDPINASGQKLLDRPVSDDEASKYRAAMKTVVMTTNPAMTEEAFDKALGHSLDGKTGSLGYLEYSLHLLEEASVFDQHHLTVLSAGLAMEIEPALIPFFGGLGFPTELPGGFWNDPERTLLRMEAEFISGLANPDDPRLLNQMLAFKSGFGLNSPGMNRARDHFSLGAGWEHATGNPSLERYIGGKPTAGEGRLSKEPGKGFLTGASIGQCRAGCGVAFSARLATGLFGMGAAALVPGIGRLAAGLITFEMGAEIFANGLDYWACKEGCRGNDRTFWGGLANGLGAYPFVDAILELDRVSHEVWMGSLRQLEDHYQDRFETSMERQRDYQETALRHQARFRETGDRLSDLNRSAREDDDRQRRIRSEQQQEQERLRNEQNRINRENSRIAQERRNIEQEQEQRRDRDSARTRELENQRQQLERQREQNETRAAQIQEEMKLRNEAAQREAAEAEQRDRQRADEQARLEQQRQEAEQSARQARERAEAEQERAQEAEKQRSEIQRQQNEERERREREEEEQARLRNQLAREVHPDDDHHPYDHLPPAEVIAKKLRDHIDSVITQIPPHLRGDSFHPERARARHMEIISLLDPPRHPDDNSFGGAPGSRTGNGPDDGTCPDGPVNTGE